MDQATNTAMQKIDIYPKEENILRQAAQTIQHLRGQAATIES